MFLFVGGLLDFINDLSWNLIDDNLDNLVNHFSWNVLISSEVNVIVDKFVNVLVDLSSSRLLDSFWNISVDSLGPLDVLWNLNGPLNIIVDGLLTVLSFVAWYFHELAVRMDIVVSVSMSMSVSMSVSATLKSCCGGCSDEEGSSKCLHCSEVLFVRFILVQNLA